MSNDLLTLAGEGWAIIPDRLDGIHQRIAGLGALTISESAPVEGFEVMDGTARIPIHGILMKRPGILAAILGAISMVDIGTQVRAALADPSVQAIVLDIDSPGGTVDGTQALAEIVRSVSDIKPVIAFVNGLMASAAYWIGSAADWIVAPPTGEVGSIGVVQAHYDYSGADAQRGVKRSYIYAGKYKTIGNDAEPLSEDGMAYLQAGVDYVYSLFVDTVARNRGMLVQEVLDSEGRLFIGEQARGIAFVDQVGYYEDALARGAELADRFRKFGARLPSVPRPQQPPDVSMPNPPGPGGFTQAWKAIKAEKNCSTAEAMKQAVREYPHLHEAYLRR